jgi:hypothetical protein
VTTERAKHKLREQFPNLKMEVEEYLSFADIDEMTDKELEKDFEKYMAH